MGEGLTVAISVKEAEQIIKKAECLPDDVMTNCGHTINRDVAQELERQGPTTWAGYPCWNCYCLVWHQDGMYHCLVMRFHSPQEVVSRVQLQDIMDYVSEEYGAD